MEMHHIQREMVHMLHNNVLMLKEDLQLLPNRAPTLRAVAQLRLEIALMPRVAVQLLPGIILMQKDIIQ